MPVHNAEALVVQDTHQHAAAVARAVRRGDAVAEVRARQDLAAHRVEHFLRVVFAAAPPLRSEQAERLHQVIEQHAESAGPVHFGGKG